MDGSKATTEKIFEIADSSQKNLKSMNGFDAHRDSICKTVPCVQGGTIHQTQDGRFTSAPQCSILFASVTPSFLQHKIIKELTAEEY